MSSLVISIPSFGELTLTVPSVLGEIQTAVLTVAPATITMELGTPGPQGQTGATGATGPAGPGVPTGGSAGQVLAKVDGVDYNTEWVTNNSAVWGNITGTLSNQTDLQSELDGKYSTSNPAGYITTASAAATYQTISGMSAYLQKSGGTITGDIQSNNNSAYRSYDGSTQTSVLNSQYLQFNKSGTGGGALTVEWDGITFADGKQVVRYPGTSILAGYATESWTTSNFAPIAAGQPTSGTVGQVLTKNSGTSYDSSWQTLIPGDRYLTTSTSTLTVNNGTKNLTVGTGLSYSPQQDIVISYDGTAHMHAVVISYNSTTGAMVADVQQHTGSGTYSVWTVNVGGTVPVQSVYWGDILGTLGDQSDLATALNGKLEITDAASTYYPLTNPAGYIDASALSGYATQSWVSSGYLPLSGGTMNGESYIQIGSGSSGTVSNFNGSSFSVALSYDSNQYGYLTYNSLSFNDGSGTASFGISGLTFHDGTTQATSATNYGYITDAPSDGTTYGRKDGAWSSVSFNGGTISNPIVITNGSSSGNYEKNKASWYHPTGGTISVDVSVDASFQLYQPGMTAAFEINNAGIKFQDGSVQTTAYTGGGGSSYITSVSSPLAVTSGDLSINLSGYATESWVTGQGYATESFVTSQGYITSSALSPYATLSSPSFSGVPTAPTAATSTNTTQIATTAFVKAQGYLTSAPVTSVAGRTGAITLSTADISGMSSYLTTSAASTTYAPLASPTFTGTVTIPAGASISGYATTSSLSSYAPLASPSLTGTPLSTTAAADTNTTQIATTAFVVGQASSTTPAATGTAAVGTSLKYARADHVHANPLPTGGTTGQVLAKVDGTNYNVQWTTAGGGGSGGCDIQTFGSSTTSGTFTWTKPSGAKWVEIYLVGAGGGGGSGARQATTANRSGGGGGGNGPIFYGRINASYLGATESVYVAPGGTGGAAVTTDSTNGNTGSTASPTTFSIYKAGYGGGGGGGIGTSGSAGSGGISMFIATSSTGISGGAGQNTVGGNVAQNINFHIGQAGGGGAGAAASSVSNAPGGIGGGFSNTSTSSGLVSTVAGGSGGTSGGVPANNGTSSTAYMVGGTGGGGGYYITGTAGGAGGNGGWPGGAGGGGGASDNGFASGKGGNGANGYAVIITYF